MNSLHGFELVREERIAELDTQAKLYRHVKTGAQLLSLENKDENKVFGIGFFTPPQSSNGLTHILEHSVLCASRKYPVKEPFVELAKSSLNTFLNAMTFSDSTWYPVASTNLRDLYNLIDVYLDCVFFPQLPPHILRQEGWHYELENPDEPIVYKGVVFNEMKGNYSSPDGLIGDYSQQSLYPDTYYAYDSGGDPKVIPTLTYDEFIAYHRRHYHPSNAMVYFYGDDDPVERLRIMDAYLSEFEAAPLEKQIPAQQPFLKPHYSQHSYAASEDSEEGKSFITVNWGLPEFTDSDLEMGLSILQYILIGSSASPLRKALIDSGLGEGLTGGGINNYQKFPYFSTGLKGIKPESASEIERIIIETLQKLVDEGIQPEMIEAAMNSTEFALREANTGSAPRGLVYLFGLIANWPYGHDPFEAIRYEKPLAALKARLATGERYFEGLIKQYLLDNQHRTTVLLTPDATLGEQIEREEAEKLAAAKAKMGESDLQQIIAETVELKEIQVTPDSEEDLEKIPTLSLADMEKKHRAIPLTVSQDQGATLLYHDLPTNGIIYLDLALEMHTLRPEQVAWAGLLRRLLLEIGTETEDYVTFSQRIGRKIGGLSVAPLVSMKDSGIGDVARMVVRGKATPAQSDDLLAILHDVLLTVKLDNRDRFKQILMQEKARLESGIVPSGHSFAMTRLGSMLNAASWANEQISGVDYLFFVRSLAEKIETDWASVLAELQGVYHTLVNRNELVVNITLDAANYAEFAPKLSAFLAALPTKEARLQQWSPRKNAKNEALTIPSQVNYVAKGANLFEVGYEPHGSVAAITNYTGLTYLWERIRVQGGAYGGFNRFNELSGTFAFASYRDPNLTATLDNYAGMADFLSNLEVSDSEVERSIIGAIGELDAYQLPDAKGYTSMVEYLTEQTADKQQQMRDELLDTTAQDFKRFGEILRRMEASARVVVVGSAADVEKANAERGGFLSVTKVL